MVRNFNYDGLNLEGSRNVLNTDRESYNCGGYALNTFSWYLPYNSSWQGHLLMKDTFSGYWRKRVINIDLGARLMARLMVKEFKGSLRIIKDLSELQKDEYAIAFKSGDRGDFHFIKRSANGIWRHKVGGRGKLFTMTKEEVFGDVWYNPYRDQEDEDDVIRYNSKTILLAKKK